MILDEEVEKFKQILLKLAKSYNEGDEKEFLDFVAKLLQITNEDEKKTIIKFYMKLKKDKLL